MSFLDLKSLQRLPSSLYWEYWELQVYWEYKLKFLETPVLFSYFISLLLHLRVAFNCLSTEADLEFLIFLLPDAGTTGPHTRFLYFFL